MCLYSKYKNKLEKSNESQRFAIGQRIFEEAGMVNETELFYLVMLIFLALIILLVLSATGQGRDGKSRR